MGALLASLIGGLWNLACPGAPPGAFAIVGAAAFLASSMKMPITAIVLIVEFTRVDHDFLFPICFAVGGSFAVFHICARRFDKPRRK
jgi:H+/Cl- antiporter ClcA